MVDICDNINDDNIVIQNNPDDSSNHDYEVKAPQRTWYDFFGHIAANTFSGAIIGAIVGKETAIGAAIGGAAEFLSSAAIIPTYNYLFNSTAEKKEKE